MNKLLLSECIFVMIDIQEKFLGKIFQFDIVIKNADILNKATEVLQIPLVITEQYPTGLGKTLDNIYIPLTTTRFEKKKFSIFTQEINDWVESQKRKQLIIYGVESHVCIMQTCLDAIIKGYQVFVVVDAVSSRIEENKKIALERLLAAGCELVSTEMLLFELIESAEHPSFKEISKLVK